MPEITYDLEPYLAKIDFTETEIDRLCVKKAEVIGVSSRQSVNIRCEGVEYDDVPVWIHTDCGARHWYMKGLEAEKNGQTPPIAPTAGEYFKDAALMFPFPGEQWIHEMPSGPDRLTVSPMVLAVFDWIAETETYTPIAVINILSSVLWDSGTDQAFRTYRPYLYYKITSKRFESTTSLNLIDVTATRDRYFLVDLLTNSSAMVPSYEDGVPKSPLSPAEMLESTDLSDVTIFLSFDKSFRVDVASKPESIAVKMIGDIHGEWTRGGVVLGVNGVCYHPDGSWSDGWLMVDGVYTSACTGSTVITTGETYNGSQEEHIVRATVDGLGKGIGGGGWAESYQSLSDKDVYGGVWTFNDGFFMDVEYTKHRVRSVESTPFSPPRFIPQNINITDFREGTQKFTIRYTPEGTEEEESVSVEWQGDQNSETSQETNGTTPIAQSESGSLLHVSDVLAYFSISEHSNFYISGFGFGIGSIIFSNNYTSVYDSIANDYIDEVASEVSSTDSISVMQYSNGGIAEIDTSLFQHIIDMAKTMAEEEDWETVSNPSVNKFSSILRRTYKYGVEFLGLYFVPFDRRIELLKEQSE